MLVVSRLYESVGNQAEHKRLLNHTLQLWREGGTTLTLLERWGLYLIQIDERAKTRRGYH